VHQPRTLPQLHFIGLLLLALLIRLIAMPIALHTDARFTSDIIELNREAYRIYAGGLESLFYPPLFYLSLGVIQKVTFHSPPLFAQMPVQGTIAQVELLSHPAIFRTLMLLKIWYLLFDLGSVFLLWKLAHHRTAKVISLFWLFNPVIIYNAYLHGQFDIVPVFFVILALYSCKKARTSQGAFWMGIAACYKNFPFLFLLPLILVMAETWRKRLTLLLWGTLPYVVLLLPFLRYGSKASNYPNLFFKAGYDLGFGAQVYIFIVFYAVLLWYLYHRRANTFEDLWRACFAILLVYYQLSYFDLHYWAWIIPFAALYWVERPAEAKLFYLVIGLCLLTLLAPTPLARFLAPISPRFFLRLPSLLEILTPYLPMLFILNVVRSLLAGTCFYLAWHVLRDTPAARKPELPATPEAALAA